MNCCRICTTVTSRPSCGVAAKLDMIQHDDLLPFHLTEATMTELLSVALFAPLALADLVASVRPIFSSSDVPHDGIGASEFFFLSLSCLCN